MTIKNESIDNTILPAKKRGRKSKKEIEEALKLSNKTNDNITVQIEDNDKEQNIGQNNLIDEITNSDDSENDNNDVKPLAKKRGRKPKGGKIIQQIMPLNNIKESKPNVILHLKCSIKDLQTPNFFSSSIEGFTFNDSAHHLSYDIINENENLNTLSTKMNDCETENSFDDDNKDNDIREIWRKLKVLEHNLHINNHDNKKSACFWDTCEFDNPPVYIPKHFINDTYQVYGCFCSPECAVAHLMEQNIDSSVKFERYQLINHIYSKIYNYNKNIKPAPNPYYMLEKYYGNLSIQEYRSLLRNERLFLVVDKPLTRVMPELHEDNDDFIINNKIIPTNNIKLRKIQKKQTKTNILNERFGLVQN